MLPTTTGHFPRKQRRTSPLHPAIKNFQSPVSKRDLFCQPERTCGADGVERLLLSKTRRRPRRRRKSITMLEGELYEKGRENIKKGKGYRLCYQ
jgi:hypothetical protein